MKIIHSLFILLIAIILFYNSGCSKETKEKEIIVADTTILSTSLKGWDLYSWQIGNERYYSLLYGTNRDKTVEEVQFITNSTAQIAKVNSIIDLKNILLKITPAENIYWHACYSGSENISMPIDSIITDLKIFCIARKLNLQIIPCN